MKPFLEKVTSADDSSWTMLNRRLDDTIPFEWHHHPEYELTLTLNSRGQRFVGDHIGTYDDADLVLLGPNLPHTWSSTSKVNADAPHVAQVMWFKPDWADGLITTLTELAPVANLLDRADAGLKFTPETTALVRPTIEAIFDKPPSERLLSLLDVLLQLSSAKDAEALSSPTHRSTNITSPDQTRIDRVLEYIHANYTGKLNVDDLADLAALSPSGFHRLFRRHTRLTLTQYITRLRIGEACAQLTRTERPIAHIADSVGYHALANFNRQFRALKQITPRDFRNRFRV